MIWKVWTISLFGRVVMTVRLDAVGWPVEEQELQRGRARQQQQPCVKKRNTRTLGVRLATKRWT